MAPRRRVAARSTEVSAPRSRCFLPRGHSPATARGSLSPCPRSAVDARSPSSLQLAPPARRTEFLRGRRGGGRMLEGAKRQSRTVCRVCVFLNPINYELGYLGRPCPSSGTCDRACCQDVHNRPFMKRNSS
eukprot:3092061-Rhodomonas_salina.2